MLLFLNTVSSRHRPTRHVFDLSKPVTRNSIRVDVVAEDHLQVGEHAEERGARLDRVTMRMNQRLARKLLEQRIKVLLMVRRLEHPADVLADAGPLPLQVLHHAL